VIRIDYNGFGFNSFTGRLYTVSPLGGYKRLIDTPTGINVTSTYTLTFIRITSGF